MIVCSCNVLSDGQIKACVNGGPSCPRTAADVYQCLGCSPKCGRCARTIRQIVANALMGVDVPVAVAPCAVGDCATACPMSHSHDDQRRHKPALAQVLDAA
jgi:bacterioferritin-associated ferredoxin